MGMTNQDAVKWLENLKQDIGQMRHADLWPYAEAIDKIGELLEAQEPVKPYIDYDGQDVWRCGSCGATLFHLSHTQADENEQNCVKFCRYCG